MEGGGERCTKRKVGLPVVRYSTVSHKLQTRDNMQLACEVVCVALPACVAERREK